MKQLTFILLPLTGCVYGAWQRHYHDNLDGYQTRDIPWVEQVEGPVRAFQSEDVSDDIQGMHEDGYAMIGYSSFVASDANIDNAERFADNLNGHIVLLYSAYSHTDVNTFVYYTEVPRSVTDYSGTVRSGGTTATYGGTETTADLIPVESEWYTPRYNYTATYWVKRQHIFGAGFSNVYEQDDKAWREPSAVEVGYIVSGSSASRAGIKAGDRILSVDGREVRDADHLLSIIHECAGDSIDVSILRGRRTLSASVHLEAMYDPVSDFPLVDGRDRLGKSQMNAILLSSYWWTLWYERNLNHNSSFEVLSTVGARDSVSHVVLGGGYRYYFLGNYGFGAFAEGIGGGRYHAGYRGEYGNFFAGPTVGGKVAFSFGLTLQARVGGTMSIGYLSEGLAPMFDVAAGWSF